MISDNKVKFEARFKTQKGYVIVISYCYNYYNNFMEDDFGLKILILRQS